MLMSDERRIYTENTHIYKQIMKTCQEIAEI